MGVLPNPQTNTFLLLSTIFFLTNGLESNLSIAEEVTQKITPSVTLKPIIILEPDENLITAQRYDKASSSKRGENRNENEGTGTILRLDPTCGDSCRCIDLYQPVCGDDGVTYNNLCVLHCASNCVGGRLKLAYVGKCDWASQPPRPPPLPSSGWGPPNPSSDQPAQYPNKPNPYPYPPPNYPPQTRPPPPGPPIPPQTRPPRPPPTPQPSKPGQGFTLNCYGCSIFLNPRSGRKAKLLYKILRTPSLNT